METQFRQGDVFLRKMTVSPEGLKENGKSIPRDKGRVILAYGEVTGHAHAIKEKEVEFLEFDGRRFLMVTKLAQLTHEEHGTIKLDPGTYEVIQQREYEPGGLSRNVLD